MRGSRKFCQSVSNSTLTTFFVGEKRVYLITTKGGPSSARLGNAILMVFRWRADDGPTLNAGMEAL